MVFINTGLEINLNLNIPAAFYRQIFRPQDKQMWAVWIAKTNIEKCLCTTNYFMIRFFFIPPGNFGKEKKTGKHYIKTLLYLLQFSSNAS